MNYSCFWGGGQPPIVITEPDTAGGERHLFTSNDNPRHLVTEVPDLCSTLQGNCAGHSPPKSVPCKHTQSISWETFFCFGSGSIWNS